MIEDMIFKSFHMNANKHNVVKESPRKVEKIDSYNGTKNEKKDNIFSKNDDKYNGNYKKKGEERFMINDTCEISEEAMRLYEIAKQAVNNVPDVRDDKVNKIKEQMKNGTYNVTAEEFSKKILKN